MNNLISLLDTQEHKEMAQAVISQLNRRIRAKNYLGWRTFIEDVLVDTVSYMISTNYRYSIGGYIQVGMTTAIDKCKYCNAQIRKQNYTMLSLDDERENKPFMEAEDEDSNFELKLKEKDRADSLYKDLKLYFGQELADGLKPIIYGTDNKIEKKILKKCKTLELKEFLEEFSMSL